MLPSKVPDLVCVSWNINLVPWSSYYCNEKKVDIYHKLGLVENLDAVIFYALPIYSN